MKHDFYFPSDFSWERPLFNKTPLKTELRGEVYFAVEHWVRTNLKETDVQRAISFNNVADRTVWNADVDCKFGVFYYHWLNEFVREVGYFAWRYTYSVERSAGMSEKEAMKLADKKQKEYETWAKGEFA